MVAVVFTTSGGMYEAAHAMVMQEYAFFGGSKRIHFRRVASPLYA